MVYPENKPCLVETGQGFSVKYNEKFLYSKYNPEKNILNLIENLEILPDTLILCFSPLLGYGLKELIRKLPENCPIIAIEKDEILYDFSQNEIQKLNISSGSFTYLSPEKADTFPSFLYKSFKGQFKRVIKIDFSAGSNLNRDFYENTFSLCQNVINQFWKNRITLVKFGRNYSSNLFKNLKLLPESNNFFKSEKAILVVGAGQSALESLLQIKPFRKDLFILATDASLQALKTLKIKADAVICEESQSIISRSFKGCKNNYDWIFLSLTSSNIVAKFNPKKNIFYTSLYTNADFIKNLVSQKIIENPLPPLGSVGLSAIQIALKIRKNENIPIFLCGLDFSYSAGFSHIKSSFHENERRKTSTKIKPFEDYKGSFGQNRIKTEGKNGKITFTNQALENYRNLLIDRFSDTKNLFDIGKTGLPLNLPQIKNLSDFLKPNYLTENFYTNTPNTMNNSQENSNKKDKQKMISNYILQERNALIELKDILTGKIQLSEKNRNARILEIINSREYLYLHFPDGYKANLSLGFLKRIRTELDYFIKILSD